MFFLIWNEWHKHSKLTSFRLCGILLTLSRHVTIFCPQHGSFSSERSLKNFNTLDEFTYSLFKSLTKADPGKHSSFSFFHTGLNGEAKSYTTQNLPRVRLLSFFMSFICFLLLLLLLLFRLAYKAFLYQSSTQDNFGLFDTDDHETHHVHTINKHWWRVEVGVLLCTDAVQKKLCEFVRLTNCNQCMSF